MKAAFACVLLIAILFSCPDGKEHEVTYEVSGTARSVSLTYENEGGDTEQIDAVSVPWRKTFQAKWGAFLYISAQNKGRSGDVTTQILIDGKVVKTSTSSGGYVIAASSISCCN